MYIVVLLLALAASLYLAGRPLFQPDPEEEALLLRGPQAALGKERSRVLGALSEIENDYQTGKLSQPDYEQLKGEYAHKAVELLKAETLTAAPATRPGRRSPTPAPTRAAGHDLDVEAEAEIALALARGSDRPAGRAAVGHCTGCGAALLQPDQKFCHVCGQTVEGRA